MIRVQTTALQDQLATQEWLASKMEHVAVMLDRRHAAMEELLATLTSVGRGFRARLGTGLDTWAEAVLRREWGWIRVTWEEVSEDK